MSFIVKLKAFEIPIQFLNLKFERGRKQGVELQFDFECKEVELNVFEPCLKVLKKFQK